VRRDIFTIYGGGFGAAPNAHNGQIVREPSRVVSIRLRADSGSTMCMAPGWTPYTRSTQDTSLLSGYGNTPWLRNPLREPLEIRFEKLIPATRYRYRLRWLNPTAPTKIAYTQWITERGPGVGDTRSRVHVCPFYSGALAAGTRVTLISTTSIPFPFAVEEVAFVFAAGVASKLRLSLWAAGNDAAPTIGTPAGRLLTGAFGNVAYVTGDAGIIRLRPSDGDGALIVQEPGQWLKVHAQNTDANAHDVNAIITIREMPGFTL